MLLSGLKSGLLLPGRKKLDRSPGYNEYVLADNPIRFWKLNDVDATAVDTSKNQGHGTYLNGVGLSSSTLTPGDGEPSASFDGVDDRVDFVNPLTGTTTASIELLVDLSSTSLKGCFVSLGGELGGVAIGVGGSQLDNLGNNIIAIVNGSQWVPTTVAIGTGIHHVGMVVSGNTFKFYKDGLLVATSLASNRTAATSTGTIGSQVGTSATRHVLAKLAKVALYDYELPDIRWRIHNSAIFGIPHS